MLRENCRIGFDTIYFVKRLEIDYLVCWEITDDDIVNFRK